MEMMDPLGKPPEIGGAQYLDALSRLGYNVESMSSSLPAYTKAANAATSLMDTAFNQRLAWDKAQADNKEAIARANQADSITNYNNATLDNRIKALDLENQKNQLAVKYDTDTLPYRESLIQYDAQQKKNELELNQSTLDARKAYDQEQAKFAQSEITQKTNDLLSAQADLDPTLTELRHIPKDAPDYDQQIAAWHSRHLNAITNPATQTKILNELKNVQDQHDSLASVKQTAKNNTDMQALRDGGHLPANLDYNAIQRDPVRMQQTLVQGRISEAVDSLQSLGSRAAGFLPTLPREYQAQWTRLLNAKDRLLQLQNPDSYKNVIDGAASDILTPDGKLRSGVLGDMASITAYLNEQAKIQAEQKPPSETVTFGKPGALPGVPVIEIQNLRPGQNASQYFQTPPAQGTTAQGTGQTQQPTLAVTTDWLNAHPDARKAVQELWSDPNNAEKQKAAAKAIKDAQSQGGGPTHIGYQYGGRVGYQTGGEVGAGSAGGSTTVPQYLTSPGDVGFLGSTTDTVPAMLTPGEFVLNKLAVDKIGPANLDAINQIGKQTSPDLTQIPAPTDTSVAAFSGLTQQQQNPDAIPKQPVATTPENQQVSSNASNVGRLQMSNRGNYAYPEGAADLNGIDRNVWANVMSEEGPEFSTDGTHMSVFGLWKGAPGAEGEAYNTIREHGANSLPAYQAVTNAWDKAFLQETKPQLLKSPGMQEMVIADSQHVGGKRTLELIQQMGGWDAINKMNPTDAIRTYSGLRARLWGTNQARVAREREWALANDSTLSGGQQVAGMQSGGMVEGNPLYGPGLGFQHGGFVPGGGGGGFESELEGGGGGGRGQIGGGFEGELDQPGAGAEGQRHRRFHPRGAGMGGMGAQPNIPDPMQRKVAKLSQDFIGGLSSLIKSRPEYGGEIMRHAKNMLASTGLGDVRTGGGGGSDFLSAPKEQPMGMNPAMMAMSGMGGEQGSSSEEAYT